MKTILMIGAGKSATYAIEYFLQHAAKNNWKLILADADAAVAKQKLNNNPRGKAKKIDVTKSASRLKLIAEADVVVSMMPPAFHLPIIKDCIKLKKNFINASYATADIRKLSDEAKAAGIVILCEMGLDPGIDHMSAMQTIHEIENRGGEIVSFKSYCGGLVAPASDDNLWNYKFSWNPRNVILAGHGTAQYLENGSIKYIPYNRLFLQTAKIKMDGYGEFEAYANRDSLSYIPIYNLPRVKTFLRGTLRRIGFCEAWSVLAALGLTDDSYTIPHANQLTYLEWFNSYLPSDAAVSVVKEKVISTNFSKTIIEKLQSIGLFSHEKIKLENATPAQILQSLLENKWLMKPTDKDMVVMQHQFEYRLKNKTHHIYSSLVLEGENQLHTAMAKTVSLPLAIGTKLILQNKIKQKGVQIPTTKAIYEPVLEELKTFGIKFTEQQF